MVCRKCENSHYSLISGASFATFCCFCFCYLLCVCFSFLCVCVCACALCVVCIEELRNSNESQSVKRCKCVRTRQKPAAVTSITVASKKLLPRQHSNNCKQLHNGQQHKQQLLALVDTYTVEHQVTEQ